MPLQNGKPIYDVADADRACGKLVTPVQSSAELTGICINNTNADRTSGICINNSNADRT
jgi:hypothetical protein